MGSSRAFERVTIITDEVTAERSDGDKRYLAWKNLRITRKANRGNSPPLQRGVEFSLVKSRSLAFNFHSMAGLPRYEPPVENLHPVDFFQRASLRRDARAA